MRRNVRVGLLALVGVATLAAAVGMYQSQSRTQGRRGGLRSVGDLWRAAFDGAVGQPHRLLGANLPRLRLRFARRPPRGVA